MFSLSRWGQRLKENEIVDRLVERLNAPLPKTLLKGTLVLASEAVAPPAGEDLHRFVSLYERVSKSVSSDPDQPSSLRLLQPYHLVVDREGACRALNAGPRRVSPPPRA